MKDLAHSYGLVLVLLAQQGLSTFRIIVKLTDLHTIFKVHLRPAAASSNRSI